MPTDRTDPDEDDVLDDHGAGAPPPPPAARRSGAAARMATRGRRATKGRRAFDIGGVIAKSFSVWFANLLPFTVLSLIGFLPLVIYAGIEGAKPIETLTLESAQFYERVVQVLGRFMHFFVEGFVVFGVFRQLRRSRASMVQCISVGVRRAVPVLGVALLTLVVLAAPMVPAALVFWVSDGRGGLAALALVLAAAGLITLVVLRLGLIVAVPTMVVEGGSMVGAMKRSWFLTKRQKGAIFGVLFLLGLITWLASIPLVIALIASQSYAVAVWGGMFFLVMMGGLEAVVAAVIYHDLRVNKEGIESEDLAAIFD